jgi:hypothetical protein
MKAMVLNKPKTPLEWTDLPDRQPGAGEIRVKVLACGVCRTDLHVIGRRVAASRPRSASSQRPQPIRSTRLTKRWPIFGPAGSKARQFSCLEQAIDVVRQSCLALRMSSLASRAHI